MDKPENIIKRQNYLRDKRELERKYPNIPIVSLDDLMYTKIS